MTDWVHWQIGEETPSLRELHEMYKEGSPLAGTLGELIREDEFLSRVYEMGYEEGYKAGQGYRKGRLRKELEQNEDIWRSLADS